MNELAKLEEKINYNFTNKKLLDLALCHRSMGVKNNERLEFLGDSIVNFVIANELFQAHPNANEGDLSRLRASLIKKETLAGIAKELNLSDYLRLGSGELKSGGHRRESILGDAMEAIIGAVFIDSDMDVCYKKIVVWYGNRIKNLPSAAGLKDPKTRLQEYCQSKQLPLPSYKIIDTQGEEHEQVFTVTCSVENLAGETSGQGSSRRRAEQASAENYLNLLGITK